MDTPVGTMQGYPLEARPVNDPGTRLAVVAWTRTGEPIGVPIDGRSTRGLVVIAGPFVFDVAPTSRVADEPEPGGWDATLGG